MSDASDTTRRRRQRMLYASKVIQETYYSNGWTNRVILEGGVTQGPAIFPVYDSMRDGTTVTTVEEQQEYRGEVPTTVPGAPTNIVATASGGEATVYFTTPIHIGAAPISNYRITAQPGGIEVFSTTSPVVISGLTIGVDYKFCVEAINSYGPSLPGCTTDVTYVIGLPGAPSGVSAVAGDSEATVSFTAPTSDGGAAVSNYTVISTPGNYTANGASSPITVTGLTNGTAYTFKVVATNANGDSPQSSASSAVTPRGVPGPPTNVTGVRGNTQVTVQFLEPGNNGGAAITAYTTTSNPGGFTATGSSSPLVVTGLTNGTPYTFTVTATNAAGTSVASDASTSTTPATVPGAPTAVSAAAGNTQAVVPFSAPASNGGSTIISYTVTSSPGGITKTGGSSPITVTGLTNAVAYTFTVVATNGIGNSAASSASNSVTPVGGNVPAAPTNVSAVPGNNQATISFTGSAFGTPTSYTVTSSPGGFTATGAGSPLTVTGLTNGTNYTFSVVGTNGFGNGNPGISNLITAGAPLAPVLTSTFPTVNDITVSFTQSANATPSVTNYRYSLNGGPFISLSPADGFSPIIIGGLAATTSYSIKLRATNSNGDSLDSNTLTVSTYTTMNTQTFSSVGSTTWTAPAGVSFVQYVIVGGGGGGGATYSDILVLGDLPFVATAPSPTAYWIKNNGSPSNLFYGYFYRGNFYANISRPFQASVLSIVNNSPPSITPNGTTYIYNKWYADTIVYWSGGAVPNVSNYFSPYFISSARCNNISGGSGGGAGGQVRSLSGTNTYTVVPGNVYSITIGAGGAGGVATATTEAVGNPGSASSFDTVTASGGSGGNFSRRGGANVNGFGNGGAGGQTYGNFFGGGGGSQQIQNNYGAFNSGGVGSYGTYLNFFGTGFASYGPGGNGGVPNTITTGTTPDGLGKGGAGTGATLNSFANGIAGGGGVVILKWYT